MKLQKQSTRKIDLTQINMTDNIRKQYDDIEILARSIERDGQLQAIGVIEQENGTFNMLYGFRRLNAFLFLCSEGKDFNQIEAKITTGDPAIIQLIENIHRDNLKPEELENALHQLIISGLTQKEIAERLNIRQSKVSDALAAKKTRDALKEKDIDTSKLSTTAVSAMRSVPDEKQKEVVEKVKQKGSTVKAVKEVIGQGKKRADRKPPEIEPVIKFVSSEPNKDNKIIPTIEDPMDEISEWKPNSTDFQPPRGTEMIINEIENDECVKHEIENSTNILESPSITIEINPEDIPWTQISIHDFLRLPEIKSIIATQKLIIESKCEKCGKEI